MLGRRQPQAFLALQLFLALVRLELR
jgi:hypothetical protein